MNKLSGGFTIIEVMLFLAVSGALAAGILVTVGGTIGAQRYRDAVDSFADFIQRQYDRTINVQNDIDDHNTCGLNSDKNRIIIDNTNKALAGTSRTCMIVGRFITSTDGTTFTARPLYIATENEDQMNKILRAQGDYEFLQKAADKSAIAATKPALLTTPNTSGAVDNYTLGWDTRIDESKTNKIISIAIVRSPVSGAIHTYFSNRTSVSDTITEAGLSQARLCVDPNGWVVGGRLGVRIDRDAALESSVQVVGEGC